MAKESVKKPKLLWRGSFAYPHEVHVIYRKSVSEKQALQFMFGEIARRQGVPEGWVVNYFKEHPESLNIELESDFNQTPF